MREALALRSATTGAGCELPAIEGKGAFLNPRSAALVTVASSTVTHEAESFLQCKRSGGRDGGAFAHIHADAWSWRGHTSREGAAADQQDRRVDPRTGPGDLLSPKKPSGNSKDPGKESQRQF